jgi:hypothetical protein
MFQADLLSSKGVDFVSPAFPFTPLRQAYPVINRPVLWIFTFIKGIEFAIGLALQTVVYCSPGVLMLVVEIPLVPYRQ